MLIRFLKKTVAIIIAAFIIITASGCKKAKYEQGYFTLGTYITVTVYSEQHMHFIDNCFEKIQNYENEISAFIEQSSISMLNRQKSGTLYGDAADTIKLAFRYAELTDGAFDPTLLSLKNLWDIENRTAEMPLPGDEQISDALNLCGYNKVVLTEDGDALKVNLNRIEGLDLGGIAKGYIGDIIADELIKNGVNEAIINLGGNVRVIGERTFNIGLRDPRGNPNDVFASIQVKNRNIVTSGDYERRFEKDGIIYHHIFDPDTGHPADSGVISVTVISENGALADAASTAILVMGKDKGLEFAGRMGLDVIIVTEDKKVYVTDGVDDLKILNQEYKLQ